MGKKVPLIITKLILNDDIKLYLVLLYIKLGMTMNEHILLKNNSNTDKYIKNISLEDILNVVKTIKQELN